MGVLDRVGYVRSNFSSLAPGNSPDQTYGNTPSVFGGLSLGGYGQSANVQGSVQATGVLILVLLGLLVLAHRRLPLGMG